MLVSSACLPMFAAQVLAEDLNTPPAAPATETAVVFDPCADTVSQTDEQPAETVVTPSAEASAEDPLNTQESEGQLNDDNATTPPSEDEEVPAGEADTDEVAALPEGTEENIPSPESSGVDAPNSDELSGDPPTQAFEQTETVETGQTETEITITNRNDVIVCNNAATSGSTGENGITAQEPSADDQANIDTGEVNVFANVLNIVNTNEINSEIVQLVENYNDLTANLLLNQAEISPQQLNRNIVAALCPDLECAGVSTYKLSNGNSAAVVNNVDVSGRSGGNTITNPGGDSEIRTGSVRALVNVLNIVNTNLINSRWTIATFNIFGDWEGDLVLPSELYFEGYRTIGDGFTNAADLSRIKKVILDVSNDNTALINNEVGVLGNSGANSITSSEELTNGSIETGPVETVGNVKNIANSTIINTDWFLSIVNTLGSWTGNIYSLPEGMSFEQTPLGLTFFSTSSNDSRLNGEFAGSMAAINEGQEVTVQIENTNQAIIENNVNIIADSGDNQIESAEGASNSRIISGPVKVLSNILNFANTNLINSNLNLGIMNVFGNWNGNVVFGYPDLTVEHKLKQTAIPSSPGRRADFELHFGNNSGSSMQGVRLRWQFDPDSLSFLGDSGAWGRSEPAPGLIEYDLGKLPAAKNADLRIMMTTARSLEANESIETMATIIGSGPEKSLGNNTSILISQTAADQGSGGSGGGGTWYPPANQTTAAPAIGDLIEVKKTNDVGSRVLKGGEAVSFRITLYNGNTERIKDAVLYDVLFGPDGEIISSEKHELGEMQPREEIEYAYTLLINGLAKNGTYRNDAYLEGVNGGGVSIRSATSESSFAVEGLDSGFVAGLTSNDSLALPTVPLKIKYGKTGPAKSAQTGSPLPAILSETAPAAHAALTNQEFGENNVTGISWPAWILFWILLLAFAYELFLLLFRRHRRKKKTENPNP